MVAIIAAVGGALLARWQNPPPPKLTAGTWLPAARATPEFRLTDQNERPAGLAQLRNAPTLVFFGFSNCPDVCPTTLALLANVRRATTLKPLRVVLITVDPDRDSPQQLKRYLTGFDPEFIGLTGASSEIENLTKSFAAAAGRQELPGGDYTMDHSATVYLLDRNAHTVAVFTPPLSFEKMRADLDALADRLS